MTHINTAKKIFAILFLAGMLGVAVSTVVTYRQSLRQHLDSLSFPGTADAVVVMAKGAESAFAQHFPGQELMLEARGFIDTLMGRRVVGNFVLIKDEGGVLNYGGLAPLDTTPLQEYAARVYWLQRITGQDGSKLLYLNLPGRVLRGGAGYALGMPYRDTNPSQDALLNYLREHGVPCLDARTSLRASGLPAEKWLYRTDTHCTSEATMAIFRALVTSLEGISGRALDPDGVYLSADSYQSRFFESAFLGDLGRQAGVAFSGLDDFTAISPTFENTFLAEWLDAKGVYSERTGGISETLFDATALTPSDLYQFTPTDFYLSGPKYWLRVQNTSHRDRPSLLIIHDEMATPLIPFLAPLFGETHAIWSRPGDFSVNIDKYVGANQFDYIVVALSPNSLNHGGMNFFTGPKE